MKTILGLLQIVAAAQTTFAAEIVDVDGTRQTVSELRIDPGWKIAAKGEDGMVAHDPLDILSISVSDRQPPPFPKGTMVLIGNSEILACKIVSSDVENLTVQSGVFGNAELPLSAIRGAILDSELGDARATDIVRQIRRPQGPGDVLRLKNNDVLQGTLFEIDQRQVVFDRDGNQLQLQRDVIQAIIFDPTLFDYAIGDDLYAEVRLADGSILFAGDAETDDDSVRFRLLSGADLKVPMHEIVDLSFRNGRVLYLSETEPTAVEVTPFLDHSMPPRMNQSVLGTPLQLGGRTFTSGIGVRSKTALRYDLTGRFERFKATIGLDMQAGDQASVQFIVLADGEVRFESGEMTAASEPQEIDVPLEDVSRLELVVDFANRGDVQDYANWCDARLLR